MPEYVIVYCKNKFTFHFPFSIGRKRRQEIMPKIKTHSGAKKRFRVTKSGKVKRACAYKNHILNKKTTKRKRNLRKGVIADVTNEATIKKMIPYK